MKAENLEILQKQGFSVPKFIVLSEKEEVNLSFSEKDFFAVRSNFSAEDSGEHSFAGQFFDAFKCKKREGRGSGAGGFCVLRRKPGL